MLTAIRTTLMFIPAAPALILAGWAAVRHDDHLLIAFDAGLTDYRVKRGILEAMTDTEYDAYELALPLAEQQRRLELTWHWRGLPRRAAMLAHLDRYDDTTYPAYVAALPTAERDRRAAARTTGWWDSSGFRVPPAGAVSA